MFLLIFSSQPNIDVTKPKNTQVNRAVGHKCREYSITYTLVIQQEPRIICKKCFCKTQGGNTWFYRHCCKKKKLDVSVTSPDKCGSPSAPNKKSKYAIEETDVHILSFPADESHYCRNRYAKKHFFSDLSIAKMYNLFQSTTNSTPASLPFYSNIFHSFNLAFKKPSVDTCYKCHMSQIEIKSAESAIRTSLEAERNAQHQLVDDA